MASFTYKYNKSIVIVCLFGRRPSQIRTAKSLAMGSPIDTASIAMERAHTVVLV
jgi:hypothetical protein